MRRKLAAGNWKMNGLSGALAEATRLADAHPAPRIDILICPPATLLSRLAGALKGSTIAVGGQDCHPADAGAHTGDISAAMLADAGAGHVILGHSERRADHGETDEDVRSRVRAAIAVGLRVIVCTGESGAERDAGETLAVVGAQLAGSVPDGMTAKTLVIAYEPVWAIGTGQVPTPDQIAGVHGFIRSRMIRRFGEETGQGIRILYGGSVTPDNAARIFAVADVDGALVGGASLKASSFSAIVRALEASV